MGRRAVARRAEGGGYAPGVDDRTLTRLRSRLTEGAGPREDIAVFAPATGAAIGAVPQASEEDVERAVAEARVAQRAWSRRPVGERAALLLRFHDLVLRRRAEGLDLIQLEGGKVRADALEEILETANVTRYYARASVSHLRPHRRRPALPLVTEAWERHVPIGVVGVISPWNFPLILGITDALPALVAGCGVVIKVDEKTPYSALWASALLDEAGLPPGLLQLVTGDGAVVGPMLIDRVDYVMFTGSTRVGRLVAAQCAERLIGCSLELGGKNAMLVLDDADVHKAAEGARKGSFSHAGQMCVGMERIYIADRLYEAFVHEFVETTRSMRLGVNFDYRDDMGSLVSPQQLERTTGHVDDAVARGATVLTGGRPRPETGPCFYEPTILSGVEPHMTLHADETFGPVVSVYAVGSDEEAVALANASPFGLNFSVWTRDVRRGKRVAGRLEAGTVNVNEAYGSAWCSSGAPMGGFKASGLGRRHGADGIKKYTESQAVAVQRVFPISGPPWLSQRRWEQLISAGLYLLRHTPGVR